uniref:Putative secreted protein n=1 Tax=Ixodes ricinus TaxID=34613 RepID=V5H2G9_IXORI
MSRALFWIFVLTYLTVFLDASHLTKAKIVYPRLIETRNSDSELTLFINDDITLSLQPADIFPDEFLLQYQEGETPGQGIYQGSGPQKHGIL